MDDGVVEQDVDHLPDRRLRCVGVGERRGDVTRSSPVAPLQDRRPGRGPVRHQVGQISSAARLAAGVPGQGEQVADRALQPVGGLQRLDEGGAPGGLGASSAVSSVSRSPVRGVRNWCEAVEEKARSRETRSSSRPAVTSSAEPAASISGMPLAVVRTLKSPSPSRCAAPASDSSGADSRRACHRATSQVTPTAAAPSASITLQAPAIRSHTPG